MHGYAITVYRHDIEANPRARRHDLGVIRGDRPQFAALSCVDGRERRAEAPPIPPLDLDEDQDRPLDANEIDFAAGGAEIARDDAVS